MSDIAKRIQQELLIRCAYLQGFKDCLKEIKHEVDIDEVYKDAGLVREQDAIV